MKKRVLAMLTLVAVLISMLCACKKDDQQSASTPEIGLEAEISVVIPAEGPVLETLQSRIAQFQVAFPGIQVTLETEAGEDSANVMLAMPDQVVAWQKEDLLLDMDIWFDDEGVITDAEGGLYPLGLSDKLQEDLVPLFFAEGCQFGTDAIYMMPLYRQSPVLYYNRTYFEENELDLPFMWDVVEAACQQIKTANPDATPLVCNDVASLFLSMCAQYGCEYSAEEGAAALWTSEAAKTALTKLNSWYCQGYFTTAGIAGQEAKLDSEAGVYMVLDSSAKTDLQRPEGSGDAYDFELGVLNLPYAEDGVPKVLVQGPGLVIFRTDDDDQNLAAWLLVRYLTAEEDFQAELAMAGGYIPVLTSVEINEKYSNYLDQADGGENIKALTALTCMEQQHNFFTAPAYEGSQAVRDQLPAQVERCIQASQGQLDATIEAVIGELG